MIDDPDWNPIEHGFVPIAEDLETTARLTFESIARIYSGQAEVQSLLELLRFRSNDRTQPTRAFGNGRFVDTSICRFDAVRQYLMLNGYGQVAVEVENKMNQLMTSFKSLDETLTAKLTRQNTTAEAIADVAKDRAFKTLFDEACSEASELAKLLRSIGDRVRWNVAAPSPVNQKSLLQKQLAAGFGVSIRAVQRYQGYPDPLPKGATELEAIEWSKRQGESSEKRIRPMWQGLSNGRTTLSDT